MTRNDLILGAALVGLGYYWTRKPTVYPTCHECDEPLKRINKHLLLCQNDDCSLGQPV